MCFCFFFVVQARLAAGRYINARRLSISNSQAEMKRIKTTAAEMKENLNENLGDRVRVLWWESQVRKSERERERWKPEEKQGDRDKQTEVGKADAAPKQTLQLLSR